MGVQTDVPDDGHTHKPISSLYRNLQKRLSIPDGASLKSLQASTLFFFFIALNPRVE